MRQDGSFWRRPRVPVVNVWLLSNASELQGMFALANKILLGKQNLTKSHVTSLKALPDGVTETINVVFQGIHRFF